MIKMKMDAFTFVGHKRTDENSSTWRLGSADMSDITFPPTERLMQLWQETIKNGGQLLVISNVGSNHRGIAIPRGIKPIQRQPFLDALSKEVTAK